MLKDEFRKMQKKQDNVINGMGTITVSSLFHLLTSLKDPMNDTWNHISICSLQRYLSERKCFVLIGRQVWILPDFIKQKWKPNDNVWDIFITHYVLKSRYTAPKVAYLIMIWSHLHLRCHGAYAKRQSHYPMSLTKTRSALSRSPNKFFNNYLNPR